MSAGGILTDTMANLKYTIVNPEAVMKSPKVQARIAAAKEFAKEKKFRLQLNTLIYLTNDLKDIYEEKGNLNDEVDRSGSAVYWYSIKDYLDAESKPDPEVAKGIIDWIESHFTSDFGARKGLELRNETIVDIAVFLSGVEIAGKQYFKSTKKIFKTIHTEDVSAGGYYPEFDKSTVDDLLDLFVVDYDIDDDTGADEEGEPEEEDYAPAYKYTIRVAFY
jgi:hypothetical protein